MKLRTYKIQIYRNSQTILPLECSKLEIELLGNVHPRGYITLLDREPVGSIEIYGAEHEAERLRMKYGDHFAKVFPNSMTFHQALESEIVEDAPVDEQPQMTREELIAELRDMGLDVKSNASKAELLAMYAEAKAAE